MKANKLIKIGLSLAIGMSGFLSSMRMTQAASTPMVYPNVQEYQKETGKTLTFADQSRLYVVANEKTLNNKTLLKDLKLMSSNLEATKVLPKAPIIVFGKAENAVVNDIVIRMQDVAELKGKKESYKIDITDKITITAQDEIGIYYGLMSVIQMLQVNDNVLEQGTIIDYPDVNVRSMHLDCARKPFSKDWIISLIKDLSWQKYNSIQIHFSENEGFRLKSDTLDAVEGFRYAYDNVLTKQDMLDIIKVAQDYHIEVIPSLDSPGHLGAVLRYLPSSYSCASLFPNDDRRNQCFNIFTNPDARQFLVDLMTEFIEFFGDAGCKHFNIGGDEFLAQFSRFSNEQYGQIMNYFNDISKIVKDNGMTPRAWNDGLLFGDYDGYTLDSDIEICYWAAPANCASVADFEKNGNKVINYSDVYMYYVLSWWWQANAVPEGDRIYNEWTPGKFSNLSGTAQTFTKPYPDNVLGGSYAIWCDDPNYMTEQQVEDDIFHRTRATAYKMWNTQTEQPDYAQFKAAVDKIGRTPGFKTALPKPGDVYQGEETATITLKYIDNFGKKIADDEAVYGVNGNEYHFTAKDIYGYTFIESDVALDGKYQGNTTITLKYQLHCDKTALEKELDNPLAVNDYIRETVADYKNAYEKAKEIYFDETSGQLAVDNALKALTQAKEKVVKVAFYPLYVETKYPLNEKDYASGYDQYKSAIDAGQTLLENQALTLEKANEAYQAIQVAKENLKKPDAKVPTINATDSYYQYYRYSNMIDGNLNSKCWFNNNQEIDKEIKFSFARPLNMSQVQIVQPTDVGDDIINGADVQISVDGKEWKTVGTLDNTSRDTTITFEETPTKYVRIIFTEGKGNWYQIAEIKFTAEEIAEDPTLKDLIKEAETLDIQGKTLNSVNTMIDSLIEGQKAYVDGKVNVSQEISQLRAAIDALKNATSSDKKALQEKIAEAKKLTGDDYTSESWKEMRKAFLDAIAVEKNQDATQKEVDEARIALDTAIKGLKPATQPTDKTDLQATIDKAGELDAKKYTETSWKVLQEALTNAKKVLENEEATQEEVDTALQTLNTAIKGLVTKPTGPTEPVDPDEPTITPKPDEKPNEKPGDKEETDNKNDKVETSDSTDYIAVSGLGLAIIGMALLKKKKES